MKTLVIIPTFNERDCLCELLAAIQVRLPQADILVVDDASPDGTGRLVAEIAATNPRISLIARAGKFGLGTAYIEGFRHALRAGYDSVVGMDAVTSCNRVAAPRCFGIAASIAPSFRRAWSRKSATSFC